MACWARGFAVPLGCWKVSAQIYVPICCCDIGICVFNFHFFAWLAVPLVGCDNACVIFSWLAVLGAIARCWKVSPRGFTFELVVVASGKGAREREEQRVCVYFLAWCARGVRGTTWLSEGERANFSSNLLLLHWDLRFRDHFFSHDSLRHWSVATMLAWFCLARCARVGCKLLHLEKGKACKRKGKGKGRANLGSNLLLLHWDLRFQFSFFAWLAVPLVGCDSACVIFCGSLARCSRGVCSATWLLEGERARIYVPICCCDIETNYVFNFHFFCVTRCATGRLRRRLRDFFLACCARDVSKRLETELVQSYVPTVSTLLWAGERTRFQFVTVTLGFAFSIFIFCVTRCATGRLRQRLRYFLLGLLC